MGRKHAFIYIFLVILAGIVAKLPLTGFVRAVCIIIANCIYTGIICHWGISANRRIMQKSIRLYVVLIAVCMLFFMLLYMIQCTIFPGRHAVSHFLWYLSYMPALIVPLLTYYATLYIGKASGWRQNRLGYLLIIPTLAIIGFFLTNDFHQLAFRLSFSPRDPAWDGEYAYGALYFIALLWAFFLLLLAFGRLYKRCKLSNAAKRLHVPLAAFLICAALALLYSADLTPHIFIFGGLPVIYCAMVISVWESLLSSGLIPANSSYDELFSASTIAAQITDNDYNVIYSSELSIPADRETLRKTALGPVKLDENRFLNSIPISGGYLIWTEDVTQINDSLTKLRQTQAMLEENRELLQAEYTLRKDRAHIDIQNRLYDRIASEIRPQLGLISSSLSGIDADSPAFERDLAIICIIGAYVKRRSNLMLICENSLSVPAAELQYCFSESLEYLKVCGIACSMDADLSGSIDANQAKLAYDMFESVVELALPDLSSLFVSIRLLNGVITVKIMCENAHQILSPIWQQQRVALCRGRLDVRQSGCESFTSLMLYKGGSEK